MLVTRPNDLGVVDLSLFAKKNDLDAVRPNDWFNIPAPVVDAITVLLAKTRENQDKILMV